MEGVALLPLKFMKYVLRVRFAFVFLARKYEAICSFRAGVGLVQNVIFCWEN